MRRNVRLRLWFSFRAEVPRTKIKYLTVPEQTSTVTEISVTVRHMFCMGTSFSPIQKAKVYG